MTKKRKTASEYIYGATSPSVKTQNFVDLDAEVEKYIAQFLEEKIVLCQNAKQEGWLGEPWQKGARGLLGYMRYSYAMQIKILQNLTQPVRSFGTSLVIINFFKSSFFRDEVKKNEKVKIDFYKTEHFEIIKKQKL